MRPLHCTTQHNTVQDCAAEEKSASERSFRVCVVSKWCNAKIGSQTRRWNLIYDAIIHTYPYVQGLAGKDRTNRWNDIRESFSHFSFHGKYLPTQTKTKERRKKAANQPVTDSQPTEPAKLESVWAARNCSFFYMLVVAVSLCSPIFRCFCQLIGLAV